MSAEECKEQSMAPAQPNPIDFTPFYLTLAQVSAAIVGLLGAVLGSRFIVHMPTILAKRMRIDEIIAGVRSHLISDRLQAFLIQIAQEIAADTAAIENAILTRTVTRVFQWDLFINPIPGGQQVDPNVHRDELMRMQQYAQRLEAVYPPRVGRLSPRQIEVCIRALRRAETAGTWPAPVPQILHTQAQELESLLLHIRTFRAEALPSTFGYIFLVLAWFIVTGVGGSLLVVRGPRWNSAPFGLFLIGLALLIGYFVFQFYEVWKSTRLDWQDHSIVR